MRKTALIWCMTMSLSHATLVDSDTQDAEQDYELDGAFRLPEQESPMLNFSAPRGEGYIDVAGAVLLRDAGHSPGGERPAGVRDQEQLDTYAASCAEAKSPCASERNHPPGAGPFRKDGAFP